MQVAAAWSVKTRLTRGQQAAHRKPDVPGEDPAFLTEVWKLWKNTHTHTHKALAYNENNLTSTLSSTIYILVLMYNNFISCNMIKENKAHDCWWKRPGGKRKRKWNGSPKEDGAWIVPRSSVYNTHNIPTRRTLPCMACVPSSLASLFFSFFSPWSKRAQEMTKDRNKTLQKYRKLTQMMMTEKHTPVQNWRDTKPLHSV